MNWYHAIRPILFALPPEMAHHVTLKSLNFAQRFKLLPAIQSQHESVSVMGLSFPNRIGLAAGLDKNAEYMAALAALGFGFIEIGTVTPKPQIGNPKPRLFRLIKDEALINRMGFNNKGVDYVQKQLQHTAYQGILGISIGKNRDTPLSQAVEDYRLLFQKLWPYASYIAINISSPNTPGLRDLQQIHFLEEIIFTLKQEQAHIQKQHKKYVPLAVKLSPDLAEEDLASLATLFLKLKVDAVIATNTTIDKSGLAHTVFASEQGGVSGVPLYPKTLAIVTMLAKMLQHDIPIIAVGGIHSTQQAQAMFAAGASLIQLYTGLIYEGPGLVKELVG